METIRKTRRKIFTVLSSRRNYFLAYLLISVFLALVLTSTSSNAFAQWKLDTYKQFKLPGENTTIASIITNLVNWLLLIFGLIAIIGFVISGIMYLVAAGDEDTQKKAKRAMIYSITGVIVGLVGLVVLKQVDAFLNARSEGGGATPATPGTIGI